MTSSDHRPLVAIATPVYNGAAFLAETMECVQSQSYPNLVHVLIDNASTDETPEIIARFQSGKVPVLCRRNTETVPVGRNWALAAALVPEQAKYFSVLCADDTLAPNAIARMVEVAERDASIELVGCLTWRAGALSPSDLPHETSVFDGKMIARRFLDKEADNVPHEYGLYRRHAQDFEQDFFDSSLVMVDTDACLRALARGKFGFVHQPLVTLRVHPAQLFAKLLSESRHTVFAPLVEIERWAHVVMDERAAARCRERHLRVIYRFMLYWRATGQSKLVKRYTQMLSERGCAPSLRDYQQAVLEWPGRELAKRYRRHYARAQSEALGLGRSAFPVDAALPNILNGKWWA
jgi:glycosyltransferase involved in cell wall biosynthesis